MKISLTSLLIAITFILNTTLAFAEAIADDDELKTAMINFSTQIGLANTMALRCADKVAFSRVVSIRTKGLMRFAEAGFPQKSVDAFDDFIQKNIYSEDERSGPTCNEDSLKLYMRVLEIQYKYLNDVLSRYVGPQ